MADRITFLNKMNDSVQIGDELHWTPIDAATGEGIPLLANSDIGIITGIGEKYVEVGGEINGVVQAATVPTFGVNVMFFMFRKPAYNGHTNISSLKGYYAEVEFTNSSTSKQELFTVGSEVTESSK